MARVLYKKRNRIGYIALNRPEALNAPDHRLNDEPWRVYEDFAKDDAQPFESLNACSSLGDFSEARQRLSQFYAKDRTRQAAIDSILHRGAVGR